MMRHWRLGLAALCAAFLASAPVSAQKLNTVVPSAPTATTPGSSDYYVLIQGGAIKKIVGNTVVRTSDTQTLTNKTIDCNSNTCTNFPGGGGGSGDVVGPASALDGHLALFDGTTGKLIKDGGAISAFLAASNNLSDLGDAAAARTNLGLGTAATSAASSFLAATNNFSDLASASTARTNLGLGSLATTTPGIGVSTALGVDVGSAGAFIVNGGDAGAPSALDLSNATGTPSSAGVLYPITAVSGGLSISGTTLSNTVSSDDCTSGTCSGQSAGVIPSTDAGKTIVLGAHAYTLAQAGTAGFTTGFGFCAVNDSTAGDATITATTSVFHGGGETTVLTLNAGDSGCISTDTDNTNYLAGVAHFLGDGPVVSPAALSGSVNNYNPTSLSTARTLRIDGGAADRNITGIAGGFNGRRLRIINIGTTNSLVLVNNSGSSSSGNKFLLSADTTLPINTSLDLVYDATSSVWRPSSRALSNSGVTAGTYGDSTHVPQCTYDAAGRATACSNVVISAGGGAPVYFTTASGVLSTTATNYFAALQNATEISANPITVGVAGTLRNCYFSLNQALSSGSYALTVRLTHSGSTNDTSITQTITSQFASDTSNTATVVAGDLLDIKSVPSSPNAAKLASATCSIQ